MKGTDLMLRDWVQTSRGECIILSLDGPYNTAWVSNINLDIDANVYLEDIAPIPLTPEILKKNGFGYIEEDEHLMHFYLGKPQFCEDMDIHIGTDKQGHYWLNTYNSSIYGLHSVHELQHALRLCGIEKAIKL